MDKVEQTLDNDSTIVHTPIILYYSFSDQLILPYLMLYHGQVATASCHLHTQGQQLGA